MALSRGNETITFLLVMLVTSFIGAFVSNTGTVALMMPIIVSLAAASGMQSSRFLMPLAFAGSLGGMLTLIGTPPNLVIDEEPARASEGVRIPNTSSAARAVRATMSALTLPQINMATVMIKMLSVIVML